MEHLGIWVDGKYDISKLASKSTVLLVYVAYYINFERRSLTRARTRGAKILHKALGGPPTAMFHSLGF